MPKTKILVVDDEKIFEMDIKDALNNLGYEVTAVVSSGYEALEQVTVLPPDLVLMDIMLKGPIGGVEAAKEIKKYFDIPVVFLSTYPDDKTFEKAKIMEPYAYILKPAEERELQIAIELAIHRHKADKSIRERQVWLDTTLKSISDAVIAADGNGRINFMNVAAETLTGWKLKESLGLDAKKILRLAVKNNLDEREDVVKKVLKNPHTIDSPLEYVLFNREKERISVEVSMAPILNHRDSGVIGVVLVVKDITDRIHYQKQIEDTLMGVGRALIKVQELRDPYTSGHGIAVSKIAKSIAAELGWEERRRLGIELAGLLHDIGNIGISADILSKPSNLTDAEREIIEEHPLKGKEVLEDISLDFPLSEAVYQHHERLDGSGYPRGLKGDKIIPEARMLSVCDVLDAITSPRSYRPKEDVGSAIDYLEANRESLFDPIVVDIVIGLIKKNNNSLFWRK